MGDWIMLMPLDATIALSRFFLLSFSRLQVGD